jgi:two-component SAPR family response regulator
MKIMTVDDEPFALSSINQAVQEALPDVELRSFTKASEALSEIANNGFRPDVTFMDIKMPGISGLEMAKRIRESSPHTNIVFVTAYSDYALDALALHPSGYLMKPASAEKVRVELDNLRFPPQRQPECRIRAQCFGNFEIFADEKPMSFQYQKSKELMAYLVDRRGAACNTAELCAVLWEGKPDTAELHKYLRKLLSDLSHSLTAVGAEEVLIKRRNSFAVAAEKIDCDYYRLLNRDVSAINTYTGEYMTQYSWAEMTLGSLKND